MVLRKMQITISYRYIWVTLNGILRSVALALENKFNYIELALNLGHTYLSKFRLLVKKLQ